MSRVMSPSSDLSHESVTQNYECSCGSELQVKVVQGGGITNMARIDNMEGRIIK